MAGNAIGTATDLSWIRTVDICGLWEVIRVREAEHGSDYPWTKDRFKFNFLPEMVYLCYKDGRTSHGSWELKDRKSASGIQYFIVLDSIAELRIMEISQDEMIFTCQGKEYLLVRRL